MRRVLVFLSFAVLVLACGGSGTGSLAPADGGTAGTSAPNPPATMTNAAFVRTAAHPTKGNVRYVLAFGSNAGVLVTTSDDKADSSTTTCFSFVARGGNVVRITPTKDIEVVGETSVSTNRDGTFADAEVELSSDASKLFATNVVMDGRFEFSRTTDPAAPLLARCVQ